MQPLAQSAAGLAALLALVHALVPLPLGPLLAAPDLRGGLAWVLGLAGSSLLSSRKRGLRALAALALGLTATGLAGPLPPEAVLLPPLLLLLALAVWPWPARLSAPLALARQLALVLLWVCWTAALGLMLPGPLLLDWLPLGHGMSWPTLATLALLALAATLQALRSAALRRYYAAREDRRIFAVGMGLLLGTSMLGAALMAALMTTQAVHMLEPALQRSAHAQAQVLDLMLADAQRAAAAVARSLDQAAGHKPPAPTTTVIPTPAGPAASAAAQPDWGLLLRRLEPLGQVAIEWRDADGTLRREGRMHSGPWQLLASTGLPLALSYDQGLVLQVEIIPPASAAAAAAASAPGQGQLLEPSASPAPKLRVQLRPPQSEARLAPLDLLGAASEVMLCAAHGPDAALCLSGSRAQPLVMPLPPRSSRAPWPVQRAWQGEHGVALLRGPQGEALAIAYAPLSPHRLALVQRLPLLPLLQRQGETLRPLLALMAALAMAGAALLYSRSFPPLRRLRAAKAQLQATFGHLPHGVLTLDESGQILDSNRLAQALCGLDAATLHGRPIGALLRAAEGAAPWSLAEGDTELLLAPAPAPAPAPGPGPASAPAATGAPAAAGRPPMPVEVTARRFRFEGRTHWLLLLRDLRSELQRRADLQRWQNIFEHAHWGVATTDPQGRQIDLVNPAFAQLHGMSAAELRGLPMQALIAPSEHARLRANATRLQHDGHLRLESRRLRRDGAEFPVLVDVSLVRQAPGGPYAIVNVLDISAQRAAQEAVQRSEALLQAVLQALPVGVWIGDAEGRIVAFNPAVERLWGRVPPMRDGRPLAAHTRRAADGLLVRSDDYPLLRAVRSAQTVAAEVLEVEHPDGQTRTLLSTAVPLIGADGCVHGAIAVNEDLTLLKRAEAEGETARRYFERLFQSAAVGMAVWDGQGRLQRVNRALCTLLGGDEATLLAASLQTLCHPGTLHADLASCERLRLGEWPKFEAERCWRRCDGQPLWLRMSVSLLPSAPTQPAQFVAQLLDIDQERRFRLALHASQARLLQTQRLARLADWELDAASGELRLSAHGWALLGREVEGDAELSLPLAEYLAQGPENEREPLRQALMQALREGRPLDLDWSLRLPDGRLRVLHLQGRRVDGEGGRTPRLIGALQDVSERKQVETELMHSRQRLRELSASEDARIEQERRHMAREVHDELGQALTAMKMELSLLQREATASASASASACARLAAAQRMLDDTLRVVRHISGNLRPAALDYGLCAALEWLAEDFGLRYELPCELRIHGQETTLDELRSLSLFRIAQESLTNVARHARASQVRITLRFAPQRLTLTVQDDGVGFDRTAVQRRSDRFGLLGMRERALKLGAHFRVRSHPGCGTAVRVVLTLAAPA